MSGPMLLQMSLTGSVLIAAVVLIRALAINRLPKLTFTALWAIVLCRLLIPFSIPSTFSIYTLLERLRAFSAAAKTGAQQFTVMYETAPVIPEETLPFSIPLYVLLWAVGAAGFAGFYLISNLRFCREFRMSLPVENAFAANWLETHPLARTLSLRQSDRISAPLTYGIVHPVILLPKKIDWENETMLRYVLTHEYVHIRRFDTLSKLFLLIALCVHWWNPLVWAMVTLANRDLELSCDEAVVRLFGETKKSAYARTLIQMEETKGRCAPLCSHFSKNAIEERITSIMNMKKGTILGTVLALTLVAGTTTVFATSAASIPATVVAEASKSTSAVLPAEGKELRFVPLEKAQKLDGDVTYQASVGMENGTASFTIDQLEWFTADSYKVWMESQKVELNAQVDAGKLTRAEADVTIADYEKTLKNIQDGQKVSKPMLKDGKKLTVMTRLDLASDSSDMVALTPAK